MLYDVDHGMLNTMLSIPLHGSLSTTSCSTFHDQHRMTFVPTPMMWKESHVGGLTTSYSTFHDQHRITFVLTPMMWKENPLYIVNS